MTTKLDKEHIRSAYDEVRDDNSDTTWVVFKYEGNAIEKGASGTNNEEFASQFGDDERAFGFIRVTTGDELSKRAKFALVTWAGSNLSALKRGKLGTDKMLIKSVIQSFAVEIMTSDKEEVALSYIKEQITKAGGANYGTGSRD